MKKNWLFNRGVYFPSVLFSTALIGGLLLTGCIPTQNTGTAQQPGQTGEVPQTQVYPAGYSKKYLPVRQCLADGKTDEVQKLLDEEEKKIQETAKTEDELVDKLRLVGLMERASLSLQTGNIDSAIKYCTLGQQVIEKLDSESYASEGFSVFGSWMSKSLGAGEFARYDAPGYEKVLLLDIASMAYLLNGNDKSYNVARLAVQWQDEEKEIFEKNLKDVNLKKSQEVTDTTGQQRERKTEDAFVKEFSKYDNIALTVPNAFVNPFGDYVTGMINEFKSIEQKSLLSNAHIAYKQALELKPDSQVLQQAVKDTKEKKSVDRLIHIVAMDGFVPEKQVMSVPIDEGLDVELPTYIPIPSRVSSIKVFNDKGKELAQLSPIANIDAMALRYQKDCLPGMMFTVFTTVLRDVAIVSLGDAFLPGIGGLLKDATDSSMEPDTTHWMSLPSTVLGARIYPQKGVRTLLVRSFDVQGKQLAEKTVPLSEGDRHFVLVRSIDTTMYAYPSKKIWSSNSLTLNK